MHGVNEENTYMYSTMCVQCDAQIMTISNASTCTYLWHVLFVHDAWDQDTYNCHTNNMYRKRGGGKYIVLHLSYTHGMHMFDTCMHVSKALLRVIKMLVCCYFCWLVAMWSSVLPSRLQISWRVHGSAADLICWANYNRPIPLLNPILNF